LNVAIASSPRTSWFDSSGPETFVSDDSLIQQISTVRKALGSFSPDARWLAYVRSTGVASTQLLVAPLAGGAPKRLASDLAFIDRFVWSPDSSYVLALGHRERWPPFRNDWFLAPADGGPVVETGALTAIGTAAQTLSGESGRGLPKPQGWFRDQVIFHMPLGDTRNLWQVRIDQAAQRIVGSPERLTHGTNNDELSSVSAGGRMIYTSYDLRADLWTVRLGADGVSASGPVRQLTNDVVDDYPDLSRDGRHLAYASRRRGQEFAVVVRDLTTGQEHDSGTLGEMPGPLFSADGHRVAYSLRRPGGGPMFVADLTTGSVEQVCDSCGVATQWHSTMGLVTGSLWSREGLTMFSLPERGRRSLLRSEGLYLFVPSFSPDGQWLTFSVASEDGEAFLPRIVVAPVRGGVAAAPAEWVTVAEGHQLGRWSPNGDAVIFWSTCEQMPCISAQRLDGATKHPVGPRLEIVRFPDRTLSPRDLEPSNGFAVGPDSIVFTLGSKRGNLWMIDLPEARD
jgi:Tol biopolymer transport system component